MDEIQKKQKEIVSNCVRKFLKEKNISAIDYIILSSDLLIILYELSKRHVNFETFYEFIKQSADEDSSKTDAKMVLVSHVIETNQKLIRKMQQDLEDFEKSNNES